MVFLGIEFGSTRIKASAIDTETYKPVAQGSYTWASKFEGGVWTYDLSDALEGLKIALDGVAEHDVCAVGISGMMHGYLAFDENWELLVPFRTWQNTMTGEATDFLFDLINFNIPQRWSIAHLTSAAQKGEEHIPRVAHVTTLAGYVHYLLTGENAVGLNEASGMFPIDPDTLYFDEEKLAATDRELKKLGVPRSIKEIFPKVLPAGEVAGHLTESGAALLGGRLKAGIPFAPPEGDAGTGMVATAAVSAGTGNVSAGTSVFAMIVLDKNLSRPHREIDMITTPCGRPVAMVHCNNCTSDTNAWAAVLKESAELFGVSPDDGELYTKLYQKSLEGDADCGGITVCNYVAGEHLTGIDSGTPLVAREPGAKFTLANFLRAQLYSTVVTLRLGMDILAEENVKISRLTGHRGLFKTPVVGQRYLAAALGADIACSETAGEGGPWGMALLAAYMMKKDGMTLGDFLDKKVFADVPTTVLSPCDEDVRGFNAYTERFKKLLTVEKAAELTFNTSKTEN